MPLIDAEDDNPSKHTKCTCGVTYFDFDENPNIACNYEQYLRDRFGDNDDDFDDILNEANNE